MATSVRKFTETGVRQNGSVKVYKKTGTGSKSSMRNYDVINQNLP